MPKIVHDTDIGAGLEISGGKLNAAATMATDAEVAAAIAAQYDNDTDWLDLSPYFATGVSAYGGGFSAPRFRRKNNRVYLEGVVTVPAPNYVGAIATLPNGFSPNAQHIFNVSVHGGAARVDAAISGAVVAITNPSAVQWLSLEGINFGLD